MSAIYEATLPIGASVLVGAYEATHLGNGAFSFAVPPWIIQGVTYDDSAAADDWPVHHQITARAAHAAAQSHRRVCTGEISPLDTLRAEAQIQCITGKFAAVAAIAF